MRALGEHVLVDYHGCDPEVLDDVGSLQKVMVETAEAIGAHIVTVEFHEFNPIGVSGVVVIAESHLTIHTWPEHGYAAVDLFTCGQDMQIEVGIELLHEALGATSRDTREFDRGQLPPSVAQRARCQGGEPGV